LSFFHFVFKTKVKVKRCLLLNNNNIPFYSIHLFRTLLSSLSSPRKPSIYFWLQKKTKTTTQTTFFSFFFLMFFCFKVS
jgi:hypothetical protein